MRLVSLKMIQDFSRVVPMLLVISRMENVQLFPLIMVQLRKLLLVNFIDLRRKQMNIFVELAIYVRLLIIPLLLVNLKFL